MNAVRSNSVDFFLGTTTPAGFKGYFEPLRREPGMQMYLIKSGPGCGKSTLMKRLAVKAEQRGELYGALNFDDAHVHGAAFKELPCDVRVFGRDGLRFVAAEEIRTLAAGERKAAAAEAKI